MAQRAKTLRLRSVVTAFGVAALLATLVVALRPWEERLLADRLQQELSTLSDADAERAVRRLALVGDSVIPFLVEALGSDRASVAQAARSQLLARIDAWEQLPAHQSSPKLAIVARSLAENVNRYGPTSRSLAADLAERILRWPTDTHAIDRSELIGNCAMVLSSTEPDRRRAERQRIAAVERSFLEPVGSDHLTTTSEWSQTATKFDSNVLAMTRLPGGGLPVESISIPAVPPSDLTAPSGVLTSPPSGLIAAPGELPVPVDALLNQGSDLPNSEASRLPPGRLPTSSAARPIPPQLGTRSSVLPLAPEENQLPHVPRQFLGGELREELPNLATIDVMRLMHITQPGLAEAAEAELMRRGMNGIEVELARRLTDTDPTVRRKLVDTLPRVPGLNPTPWLIWLSEDKVVEVRRAALTLMAASNDLDLLRRVEELARRDPDPKIAELADRLLESRQRESRRK
jgi:hypothetical protein